MLNKFVGMGRLTADPELKYTQNGVPVCTFTMAIDRSYKGEKQTDFPNIVAWRQTAEFVSRYFSKGSMICVIGKVQTRTYVGNDGKKQYVTEIVADEVEFTGEKRTDQMNATPTTQPTDGFNPLDDDSDVPF